MKKKVELRKKAGRNGLLFDVTMVPDFRRFSQNLVLSAVNQHTVFEEIFDFGFSQIQGVKIGQTGKFFDFFIYGLISGNVDVGSISFVHNPEVAYEIDQIIRIDLVLETFNFQYS